MHQTRSEVIRGLPLSRKGTTYVARASRHAHHAVPVLIALRDLLTIAANAKEVKHLIHAKKIILNGKPVKDMHQPVTLFSILQADKTYKLILLPTGRFAFEETNDTTRNLQIIRKTTVRGKKIQYGLHDGTSIIAHEVMHVGDTLIVDFHNHIQKHTPLEKGKSATIISGTNVGKHGNITSLNRDTVTIEINGTGVVLPKTHVIVQ